MIGSVIAGAAHNVPLLLGARVIQGIGMGGLTALVVAIIGTIIRPRDRGRYSGYMGAAMAVSMSGGPILGGVLVDTAGWRWCFYVCVPLAVIALFLLQRTLHVETVKKDNVSIDWMGATLLTAGVSVLLIWVSFAGQDDYYAWFSKESAFFVIGGLALLGLFLAGFSAIVGISVVISSLIADLDRQSANERARLVVGAQAVLDDDRGVEHPVLEERGLGPFGRVRMTVLDRQQVQHPAGRRGLLQGDQTARVTVGLRNAGGSLERRRHHGFLMLKLREP